MLFQRVLLDLITDERITLAAACGCLRMAYERQAPSLAAANLYTADFLVDALRRFVLDVPQGLQGGAIRKLYSSCGVSLKDLIPEVSPLAGNITHACLSDIACENRSNFIQ